MSIDKYLKQIDRVFDGHENIAHTKCNHKHVGKRTKSLISVHSVTSHKIAKEGLKINNSVLSLCERGKLPYVRTPDKCIGY